MQRAEIRTRRIFPCGAQKVGHEAGIQVGCTGAGQPDLGVPPGVFLLRQVCILLADVHAADVADLVVNGHDLPVAAVVGQIGLEADHLAPGRYQGLEHPAGSGQVGDKIAHHQHPEQGLGGVFPLQKKHRQNGDDVQC